MCKNCVLVVKSSQELLESNNKEPKRLKEEESRNQAPETIYVLYVTFVSNNPAGKRAAKIQPE